MWLSINSMPGEINYMNKDIIAFSNGMRSIFALSFSFFTIIFAVYFLIFNKNNLNNKSVVLTIFLIYFLSQVIGLSLNFQRELNLNTLYLIIYSLSTISICYIIKVNKFENILQYFYFFYSYSFFSYSIYFIITRYRNL